MDLGRYERLAPRGVGGDGMAFAAIDPQRDQRTVELRVLVGATSDPGRRKRAEQRLRAAALLRHPSAAGVEELRLEHDPPFAVLPSGEGEPLDARFTREALDLDRTWAWSLQLGGAVVEGHRLGLAHGRLTPSRVLVTPSGELLVDLLGLDFGVGASRATSLEAVRIDRSAVAPERSHSPYTEMSLSSHPSLASWRAMKRGGAAPHAFDELDDGTARAEALLADQASDVFSVAAFWFLFWFREPLSVSVWHRLTTAKPLDALPEYPTDLAPGGPTREAFADLLAEMLAADPTERPTAREAALRFESLRATPADAEARRFAAPSALGATFDTIGFSVTRESQWPAEGIDLDELAGDSSVLEGPAADRETPGPEERAVAAADTRFDARPAPARRRFAPGDTLGRFRIVAKLGEGGMGTVYRAVDPLTDREVAIKVLAPHLARSDGARRRFTKEARVLAAVNNPYVANLYEFNQDGDAYYLVLEYVRGRSVDKLLEERGKLPEDAAVSIAADVARALIDAHRRGIVHRDVKPENILVVDETIAGGSAKTVAGGSAAGASDAGPTLQAKLTDFGIAGVREPSESMAITQAGSMLGTPLYMAPEQWEKGANVDASSDVYSLGATLFHLLTGRPPFEAQDAVTLMKLHCLEAAPAPRSINPAISEAVDEIVRRALAKRPADRFPDAESLLDALERHLRGEPSTAEAHPRLPAGDPGRVYEVLYSWELESSPERLWPLVANTDRLNQAIGLPAPTYETVVEDGVVRRFGQAIFGPVRMRWEEHPFEWIENRRLSVFRDFESGPFAWFTSIVDLLERPDGGTTVNHRIRLQPRGLFGRLVAAIEIGYKARRNMDRMHRRLDEWARRPKSAEWTDPFTLPPALPMLSSNRIATRMLRLRERGVDAACASALEHYLRHAPDQPVSRMRPWALADELGVDRNAMLTTLLHASREGLVKMMWDVLCPVCRIPSESHDSLTLLRDHGRCEVCNLDFELDFAESIELFFRGHPDVRNAEPKTYCVGAPTFSPHVVAQVRLAPHERFELTLTLPTGDYLLRGPQLPYNVPFVVDARSAVTRWDHPVGRRPSLTEDLRFSPERQTLVLRNTQAREVIVRVERTATRSDAVTAAFASAFGPFREIMPSEILAAGRAGAVPTVTILFAAVHEAEALYSQLGDAGAFDVLHRAFQLMDREIRLRDGALVKTIGGGVLAVFSQIESALAGAAAIARALPKLPGPKLSLQACVHRGPAMLTTINQRLDYFGSAVNVVSTLVRAAGPGEAILTSPVFSDPGVRRVLTGQPSSAGAGSLSGPSSGKGFLRAKLPNGSSVLVQRVRLDENVDAPPPRR